MYQSAKEKLNKTAAAVALSSMSLYVGSANAAIDVSDAVAEISSGKASVTEIGVAILVVLGVVAAFKYVRAGLR